MTFALALPRWIRRAARPQTAPRRTFELMPGQRLSLRLEPGDGLRIVAGEVVLLRPPRWLAESLVAPAALRLREGEGWASVEGESVVLAGSRASVVVRLA